MESKKTGSLDYPPFQLGKPRFDQSTFNGRLKHFLNVVDPRTLLTTEAQLQSALKLLQDFRNENLPPEVTDKDLWEAQKIKDAIIHPDTGEKIFMPFRMSGFVPFGTPIVTGLLLPNPTAKAAVFWQWLNQTHNACVNYANRNATMDTPIWLTLLAYGAAVFAAVTIVMFLRGFLKYLPGSSFSASTKALVPRFLPYPAVAMASVTNVVTMRLGELQDGIKVTDKSGNVIGTSRKAARKALEETAVTRAILPAPILIIPPIVMTMLEKTALFKRFPRLNLPVHAAVVTMAFGGALPVTIAMFPQVSKIHRSKVEPEVQQSTKEEYLFYNKGL